MKGVEIMGRLKIHCYGCGSDWEVFQRDDLKNWKSRTCPVCGKKISMRTWETHVLKAFDQIATANLELTRDHVEDHNAQFSIAYVPDVIFPNSGHGEELRAEIADLRESVDSMKAVVRQLLTRLFEE